MISYAAPALRPQWLRPGRPRGSRAAGLAYERALGRVIPRAVHGQWFQYIEDGEPKWCQTDFHVVGAKSVVIFEAKLANYAEAFAKLKDLYLPVGRLAWPERRVGGVIVLKSVANVPEGVAIFENLRDAIDNLRPNGEPTLLHWLGKGPI